MGHQKSPIFEGYTKNQIAIDAQTQVILAQKVARGPRHDSKDAIATIRKTSKYKPCGFSLDKAFDSEEIHRVIHEELEASSMIPPKKRLKKRYISVKHAISLQ